MPSFNINGMNNIFQTAKNSNDPTIAFEIQIERGRFAFLMFLSKEEIDQNDKLFIYFRNINELHEFKLYGNHDKGDFYLYLNEKLEGLVRRELGIEDGNRPFVLEDLLERINNLIPQEINSQIKTRTIRNSLDKLREKIPDFVDEEDKIYLIGIKHLPKNQKPRDKTLRKLYLHVGGNNDDISDLIENLKNRNITLAWTSYDTGNTKTFANILTEVAQIE